MTRAGLMSLAAALFVPAMLTAAPLPEKADLLATNTVVAVYRGKVKPPCRFLTSECPDHCGHSREQAVFTVKNSSYPVRPVTSLTVLPEKEQVEPLQPQDVPGNFVMPIRRAR